MSSSSRVRALLAAAALALLAACSGSDVEPRVLPSVSASASASASAVASPSGINAPTPEGAAAFARYFYAEITRAFAERDPEIVARLSLPTCKTCKLYIDSIAGVRDRRETVEGAIFTVTFAVAPADSRDTASVDVGWNFAGATFRDSSGSEVDSTPAESGVEERMELRRVGDDWKVATVKRVRKR